MRDNQELFIYKISQRFFITLICLFLQTALPVSGTGAHGGSDLVAVPELEQNASFLYALQPSFSYCPVLPVQWKRIPCLTSITFTAFKNSSRPDHQPKSC